METQISLKKAYYVLLDVLRQLKWMILAAAVCAALAFVIARETFVPHYVSTTSYFVESTEETATAYTRFMTSQQLARSLTSLISTDQFRKLVAGRTGIPEKDFSINASLVTGTNLVEIECRSSNPKSAFVCLKDASDLYPELMSDMSGRISFTMVRSPKIASFPTGSSGAVKAFVIGGFAGFFAVLAVFVVVSLFKKVVNEPKDLRENFNTVLLQSVPYESRGGMLRIIKQDYFGEQGILINGVDCSPAYEEAIKGLRNKINAEKKEGALVTVVTSALPNEGKSSISANLALALAQQKHRVALLDLDIYNGSLSQIFPKSAEHANSIDEYIFSDKGWNTAVKIDKNTGIMLFFGKKNAARRTYPIGEIARLIDYLKAYADYIIIDTPPVLLFSDSAETADFADISMLIVREHHATEGQIGDAISTLKGAHAEFIGCVYNGERMSASSHKYGYGYGGYGYGYGAHTGDKQKGERNEKLTPESIVSGRNGGDDDE
ncbi:MAG: P-loop NTPase [Clostridia bacterium]|nr:P-loop NTPase [Clostridia bacterium]